MGKEIRDCFIRSVKDLKVIEKEKNLGTVNIWNSDLVASNPRFEQNYAVSRELPDFTKLFLAESATTVNLIKKCMICCKGYSPLTSIGLTDIGLCDVCRRIWNGGGIYPKVVG